MLERWRLILRYLPPYRRDIAIGFSALFLANLATAVAVPLLLRQAVKVAETGVRSGRGVDLGAVLAYAGAAVAFTVGGAFGAFFKRDRLMRVSRRAETDLRRDLFRHVQRLPRSFFDRIRTGDLMSRATADIEAARMAIGPSSMYIAEAVLRFVLALAVMLAVDARLTAVLLLPLLGVSAGLIYLAPRIHRASRRVQDQLAAVSTRAQESFSGARVIKTFATEDREQADLEGLSRDYLDANLKLAHVRGLTTAHLTLMMSVGLGLLLYVGGRFVIGGSVDYADLVTFQAYLVMLTWPMMAVGWVLSLIQRGAAGLDRLKEVFDVEPERSGGESGPPIEGEIRFCGLSFSYGDREVLHDIRLTIPAGTTLGIVGPTGSGKSTLVSLLPRLYEPPEGTLFVDGREIHEIPLSDLRGAVSCVPQEAFLFSATLAENIGFGRPEAEEAVLAASASDAHLQSDLETFPSGLQTRVGERGVTLSGGQKQRAALARALATDSPILVLDDALSAVDSETEVHILANLRRVRHGRTVLLVAHRVSAVRDADWIVYLEDGRIVEEGTHSDLVAAGGRYARLARAQELEAEIEAMEA